MHKISLTCLPTHEPNKSKNSRHSKIYGESPQEFSFRQGTASNYAEKNTLIGFQYQMVSPENIRVNIITQTEQTVFMRVRIYIYVHICM